MKAVFLDRDGTVNYGVPRYERVDSINKVELLPNTLEALRLLAGMDYGVFFVTNQAGLAEGLINRDDLDAINERILKLVEPTDVVVFETYVCPQARTIIANAENPSPSCCRMRPLNMTSI
jgi:HAD superfamily hydrolase (TIGR01662 family)